MIAVGPSRDRLLEAFTDVERVDTVRCEYCMPFENDLPVHVARGLKAPVAELWQRLKKIHLAQRGRLTTKITKNTKRRLADAGPGVLGGLGVPGGGVFCIRLVAPKGEAAMKGSTLILVVVLCFHGVAMADAVRDGHEQRQRVE